MTRLAGLLVSLTLPLLLVPANVLLVMTPLWLATVYSRPGFPQDSYGLSTSSRIEIATRVTHWLGSGEGPDVLAGLRFPDGRELFNGRELRHLHDVKQLTGAVYRLAGVALLLFLMAAQFCRKGGELRPAMRRGAWFTLALLAGIFVLSVFNWDQSFTDFHRLFFASGTWYFAYSDTLIRAFPEQFWFDAVVFLAGLTALQATLLIRLTQNSLPTLTKVGRLLYWPRRDTGVS